MVDHGGVENRHGDNNALGRGSGGGAHASFVGDVFTSLAQRRVQANESRRFAPKANKVVVSLVLISLVLAGIHAAGINIGPWQHFVSEARGLIRLGSPPTLLVNDVCNAKLGVTPEPYEDFEGGLNPRALAQSKPTLRPCLKERA